jgi:hypothetical protein
MKDLIIRPLTASEEPLFESLAEPACRLPRLARSR